MAEVTIRRFDISLVPDHGRPRVAEFRGERQQQLSVHIRREDGSLWLFADGVAGGAYGPVVFPTTHAAQLLAWVDGDGSRWPHRSAPASMGCLWVEGGRAIIKTDAMNRRKWAMRLGDEPMRELRTCLREWAQAVLAHNTEGNPDGSHGST